MYDAASQTALIEAVAVIARRNDLDNKYRRNDLDNKRRRLDNSNDIENVRLQEEMRLQREQKDMQLEELRQRWYTSERGRLGLEERLSGPST